MWGLNYSIPLGLLDLGEFNLLQTFNPYRDFQGISCYDYFHIVRNIHFFIQITKQFKNINSAEWLQKI